MNRKLLVAAACVPWGILVFLVTWVLTFPGRAVADRAAAEVLTASGGRSLLEIGDLGPWWVGLRASDVRVYDYDPRKPDLPSTLKLAADTVRVRVSPWGYLRGNRHVTAALTSGETTVDLAFTVRPDEERTKGWTMTRAWLSSPGARLEDVSALAPLPMVMTGLVDLALDLAGEGGMRTAVGKASLSGKGLAITEVTLEGLGELGFGVIAIDVLALELEVEEGRARFVKGEVSGPMFDAEIGGDITLRDEPGRSNLRLTAVIEARGELEKYAAFAGDARWADGKLHFVCTGYATAPACRADREGGRRSSRATAPAAGASSGATASPTLGTGATEGDEDRAKRREEARERVRRRREEREGRAAVPAGEEPVPVEEEDEEPMPLEEEEPAFEEEPFPEEQLPPEE